MVETNFFHLLILVVALLLPLLITDRYYSQFITMSCLFAIGALSLNLILGYTGQASLAHGGFFGIGAYATTILTLNYSGIFGWPCRTAAFLTAFIGLLGGHPGTSTPVDHILPSQRCVWEKLSTCGRRKFGWN